MQRAWMAGGNGDIFDQESSAQTWISASDARCVPPQALMSTPSISTTRSPPCNAQEREPDITRDLLLPPGCLVTPGRRAGRHVPGA